MQKILTTLSTLSFSSFLTYSFYRQWNKITDHHSPLFHSNSFISIIFTTHNIQGRLVTFNRILTHDKRYLKYVIQCAYSSMYNSFIFKTYTTISLQLLPFLALRYKFLIHLFKSRCTKMDSMNSFNKKKECNQCKLVQHQSTFGM